MLLQIISMDTPTPRPHLEPLHQEWSLSLSSIQVRAS